jgi:predicted transcriptional regulator
MTPQQKANELYSKYDDLLNKDFINPIVFDNQLKQCALIAVDEILRSHHNLYGVNNKQVKFYSEVQQEIENL